jgi:cell division protein FtsB
MPVDRPRYAQLPSLAMDRRPARTPELPEPTEVDPTTPAAGDPGDPPSVESAVPGLDSLPLPGITRRRVAFLVTALVTAWIVIVFARQVSDASAATSTAERIAQQNTVLTAQVASLERELQVIQQPGYIALAARAYGLGSSREVPFRLADGAAALGPDAPGSASQALGTRLAHRSPLETWLSVLFGPAS